MATFVDPTHIEGSRLHSTPTRPEIKNQGDRRQMSPPMNRRVERVSFDGSAGDRLDARLDLPIGAPNAFALFAHCFTCSMESPAATQITRGLVGLGIGVLRFDFTGLGGSDGDFANTNFSSNVEDLVQAADTLRARGSAPRPRRTAAGARARYRIATHSGARKPSTSYPQGGAGGGFFGRVGAAQRSRRRLENRRFRSERPSYGTSCGADPACGQLVGTRA